jgi:hypothetical protein
MDAGPAHCLQVGAPTQATARFHRHEGGGEQAHEEANDESRRPTGQLSHGETDAGGQDHDRDPFLGVEGSEHAVIAALRVRFEARPGDTRVATARAVMREDRFDKVAIGGIGTRGVGAPQLRDLHDVPEQVPLRGTYAIMASDPKALKERPAQIKATRRVITMKAGTEQVENLQLPAK